MAYLAWVQKLKELKKKYGGDPENTLMAFEIYADEEEKEIKKRFQR